MNLEQIFKAKLMQSTLKIQYMQGLVQKIFKFHARLRKIALSSKSEKADIVDLAFSKEEHSEGKNDYNTIRNALEILNKIKAEKDNNGKKCKLRDCIESIF